MTGNRAFSRWRSSPRLVLREAQFPSVNTGSAVSTGLNVYHTTGCRGLPTLECVPQFWYEHVVAGALQHTHVFRDAATGWPIIYQGMPLQDAIDLAVYLIDGTIGHSRFAVGPPVCGGQIDVATMTHRGFRWVKRKDWVVKTDSVFF